MSEEELIEEAIQKGRQIGSDFIDGKISYDDYLKKTRELWDNAENEMEILEKTEIKVWADFVFELRRSGYWGDVEEYRPYFKGYFGSYFDGESDQPYEWHLSHCCDALTFNGPSWSEWTEADKKKAEREHARLINMVRKTFKTNREAFEFANSNDIKVYSVKNVKTREFPLFGVWVMEWEHQGKDYVMTKWFPWWIWLTLGGTTTPIPGWMWLVLGGTTGPFLAYSMSKTK